MDLGTTEEYEIWRMTTENYAIRMETSTGTLEAALRHVAESENSPILEIVRVTTIRARIGGRMAVSAIEAEVSLEARPVGHLSDIYENLLSQRMAQLPAPCPKCTENVAFRLLAVEHANVTANEAIQYQKSIRDLQAKIVEQSVEIERLKTVPMKYRRMAFNAQLQEENTQQAALIERCEKDVARINWLETLFVKSWNGAIDSGSVTYWRLADDFRHRLQNMNGETFRDAIDAADAIERLQSCGAQNAIHAPQEDLQSAETTQADAPIIDNPEETVKWIRWFLSNVSDRADFRWMAMSDAADAIERLQAKIVDLEQHRDEFLRNNDALWKAAESEATKYRARIAELESFLTLVADTCETAERRVIEQNALIERCEKDVARYKYVRRLNVPMFKDLVVASRSGEIPFDSLVDAAIAKGAHRRA